MAVSQRVHLHCLLILVDLVPEDSQLLAGRQLLNQPVEPVSGELLWVFALNVLDLPLAYQHKVVTVVVHQRIHPRAKYGGGISVASSWIGEFQHLPMQVQIECLQMVVVVHPRCQQLFAPHHKVGGAVHHIPCELEHLHSQQINNRYRRGIQAESID